LKVFEKDGCARGIELALEDEMDHDLVRATAYLEPLLLDPHASAANLLMVGKAGPAGRSNGASTPHPLLSDFARVDVGIALRL
jgi:hypothetical protein